MDNKSYMWLQLQGVGVKERSISQACMAGKRKYGIPSNFPKTILLKRHFLFVNDKQNSGNSSAPSFTNILRRVLTARWSVSSLTLKSSSNKPGPLNKLLLNGWSWHRTQIYFWLIPFIFLEKVTRKKMIMLIHVYILLYTEWSVNCCACSEIPCKWFYE